MKVSSTMAVSSNKGIKFPWDIPRSNYWGWAVDAITTKELPPIVWQRPASDKTVAQIATLIRLLQTDKNFIMCFCRYLSYMRDLYLYVAATWICTTRLSVSIFSTEDIINAMFQSDIRDTMENTDLLIIPYSDATSPMFKNARATIGQVLQKRRLYKRATITDLYVSSADNLKKNIKDLTVRFMEIYGRKAFESFTKLNARTLIVSVGE